MLASFSTRICEYANEPRLHSLKSIDQNGDAFYVSLSTTSDTTL